MVCLGFIYRASIKPATVGMLTGTLYIVGEIKHWKQRTSRNHRFHLIDISHGSGPGVGFFLGHCMKYERCAAL